MQFQIAELGRTHKQIDAAFDSTQTGLVLHSGDEHTNKSVEYSTPGQSDTWKYIYRSGAHQKIPNFLEYVDYDITFLLFSSALN